MATKNRKQARPAIKTNGAYEAWVERNAKIDRAPYVPNGNRVFSLFADTSADAGKRQVSPVMDWSLLRD